jgi:hypothetical protein
MKTSRFTTEQIVQGPASNRLEARPFGVRGRGSPAIFPGIPAASLLCLAIIIR